MKRLLYIATLFLFVLAFSSCAKDELEAPTDQSRSQAIRVDATDQVSTSDDVYVPIEAAGNPNTINDDGDDEDEDEGIKSGDEGDE